mgnify:CR=1 FL=1
MSGIKIFMHHEDEEIRDITCACLKYLKDEEVLAEVLN